MKSFACKQKGRSPLMFLYGTFTALLAIGFFASGNLFGAAVGVGLVFVTASFIFSAIKNDEWSLQVNRGVMRWNYPRWPESKGEINLADVKRVVISDSWISVTLVDGSFRRLQLIGYPHRFHAYLTECFPRLSVELRESS